MRKRCFLNERKYSEVGKEFENFANLKSDSNMKSRVLKLKKIQHGIPVYQGELVEPVPVTEIAEHSKRVRRGKRVR